LINYHVDPDSRPSTLGPAFSGHFRLTADTPKGLTPFEPSIPLPPLATSATTTTTTTAAASGAPPLAVSRNILDDASASLKRSAADAMDVVDQKPLEKKACASCQVDCGSIRYHSTKIPSLDLCPVCFKDGRFPSTCLSGDFIKISSEVSDPAEWSDQETLMLLEGLEMFPDDWSKVASHVKSHSREECILKFLKLPIEDSYVGNKADLGILQITI
jgi:SWI/SNF related-matrix-associated actin-dependent regulator of chromatin subfamily C